MIERLVQLELLEKNTRSTAARIRTSKLGKFKNLADYDWSFPAKIDRTAVDELMSCDFIRSHENIIIAGAQGLGKTMIAKNIAHEAILKGHKALFTTASAMVLELNSKKESHIDFKKAIGRYTSPDLLVIDELGYLSYDCAAADAIFEIINRRYETGSIIHKSFVS